MVELVIFFSFLALIVSAVLFMRLYSPEEILRKRALKKKTFLHNQYAEAINIRKEYLKAKHNLEQAKICRSDCANKIQEIYTSGLYTELEKETLLSDLRQDYWKLDNLYKTAKVNFEYFDKEDDKFLLRDDKYYDLVAALARLELETETD